MSEHTELDEGTLGMVFEQLSQEAGVGAPPLAAIVAQGRRRRATRRAWQAAAGVTAGVVLAGGGWLAGQASAGPTRTQPMAAPPATRATPTPSSSATSPKYTMTKIYPQWSGTISGVHWNLGVTDPDSGGSCTAVVAGVGRIAGDAAIYGCDQGPLSSPGQSATTGFLIPAPSGHGYVGFVTIGQVNKKVASVNCLWRGKHQTVPTFHLPGLIQTYFAIGVPDTSSSPTNPACTLLNAQGKDVGRTT